MNGDLGRTALSSVSKESSNVLPCAVIPGMKKFAAADGDNDFSGDFLLVLLLLLLPMIVCFVAV